MYVDPVGSAHGTQSATPVYRLKLGIISVSLPNTHPKIKGCNVQTHYADLVPVPDLAWRGLDIGTVSATLLSGTYWLSVQPATSTDDLAAISSFQKRLRQFVNLPPRQKRER